MPVEVFISYCHVDERFRKELEAHLAPLTRQGLVTTWHDRDILPGDTWATRINHAINRCGVVLLLVSADFVHSDYCWGVEMKRALERHGNGEAVVVPIFIRRCDWAGAPFSHIQGLPKDAKAVDDWAKRDHAWTDVAKGIRRLIAPQGQKASAPPPAAAPGPSRTPAPQTRQQRLQAPSAAESPLDRFLSTFMAEGGKAFAREGGKLLARQLVNPTADEGAEEESSGPEDLAAALLEYGDHGRLGDILRSGELPVPRKKAERARAIADAFEWNAELVDDAFTAPLLRNLCSELDIPLGRKREMVQALVSFVDSVFE